MKFNSLAEIVEQLESCQFATDESGKYRCESGSLSRNRAFIALKETAKAESLKIQKRAVEARLKEYSNK